MPTEDAPMAVRQLMQRVFPVPVSLLGGFNADGVVVALIGDDAAPGDSYRATISWGDGTAATLGTVTRVGDWYHVTGSHAYRVPGAFPIQVTVDGSDEDHVSTDTYALVGDMNQRLAARLYFDLFAALSPAATLGRISQLLNQGATVQHVALDLQRSREYHAMLSERIYKAFLHRAPTADEREASVALLERGGHLADLKAGILGSTDYFEQRGDTTNAGFLVALYHDVLGRDIDPSEETSLLWQLDHGDSRVTIATQLLHTLAAEIRIIETVYRQFIHRPPDSSEFAWAVDALENNGDEKRIIAHLAGTPYYLFPNDGVIASDSPDVSFQLALCLDTLSGFANTDIRIALLAALQTQLDALRGQYSDLFPDPVVQSVCWNGQERGGIWRRSPNDLLGEDLALREIEITPGPPELYTFRFTSTALSALVDEVWNSLNKYHDHVELRDKKFTLHPPNRAVLQVFGTYHALIDLSFTATYTDTLSIVDGRVRCTTDRSLDVDTSALEALTWLVGLFGGIPLPGIEFIQQMIDGALETAGTRLPALRGVGCRVASIFPTEFLLQGGRKLVFSYDDLKVDPAIGIQVSGSDFPLEMRQPQASVAGPRHLIYRRLPMGLDYSWVAASSPMLSAVRVGITAWTSDLRAPLAVTWGASRGTIEAAHALSTHITFEFDPAVGGAIVVSVQAQDADGLQASGSGTIQVVIDTGDPPPPPPRWPPPLPHRMDP
jgi:hypothetical protein